LDISVIIPTFNRCELLRRTLACLENQTLESDRYEVIVCDDGSSDSTAKVVEEFTRAGKANFRYVRQPNQGPAAARNLAGGLARSGWLAMTDDDCLPQPDWLATLLASVEREPDLVAVEGQTECPDPHPLQHWMDNRQGGYGWTCNLMVSRTLFEELGGFDTSFPYPFSEDVDLVLRIKKAGVLRFAPEARVLHPSRPQTLWAAARKMRYQLSDWVLYRKDPEGYARAKPCGHPWRSLLWTTFCDPVIDIVRWSPFYRRHPKQLVKKILLIALERWVLVTALLGPEGRQLRQKGGQGAAEN
jgi:glycosyltransferase involved in cell wall biosynthesis